MRGCLECIPVRRALCWVLPERDVRPTRLQPLSEPWKGPGSFQTPGGARSVVTPDIWKSLVCRRPDIWGHDGACPSRGFNGPEKGCRMHSLPTAAFLYNDARPEGTLMLRTRTSESSPYTMKATPNIMMKARPFSKLPQTANRIPRRPLRRLLRMRLSLVGDSRMLF